MKERKNIGLIAHDACKADMIDWIKFNAKRLGAHKLICTGTTGKLVKAFYQEKHPQMKLDIVLLRSGPLGGDQQMGALIASEQLDLLIFFTDPMTMQPHDVDVKALLRLCSIENIVVACTRSTADFVISSKLFDDDYEPVHQTHSGYLDRLLQD